jgi:hypothetical protein
LCWSAKDRKFVARHPGGRVALWTLELDPYKAEAEAIANRNLTRAEWRRYFPDRTYHATFDSFSAEPAEEQARPHESKIDARAEATRRGKH